jgi:hypothetical protein
MAAEKGPIVALPVPNYEAVTASGYSLGMDPCEAGMEWPRHIWAPYPMPCLVKPKQQLEHLTNCIYLLPP